MQWYLNKGLAVQIQEAPPQIRLLFAPKSTGHLGDPFFLQDRKNICVVCGTIECLTRHHVLPHCYRKWYPRELDRYGTYDVIALCDEDHNRYNEAAWEFERELSKEFGIPLRGVGGRADMRVGKAIGAALGLQKHREKMPKWKVTELETIVREFFDAESLTEKDLPTEAALREFLRSNRTPHRTFSQLLVSRFEDDYQKLGEFTVRWRLHFVQHMNPQFMPDHWEADRIFFPE